MPNYCDYYMKVSGKNQKNAAGMTKEEKTMVEAMKESQRKTRALILSAVFGAIFCLIALSLFKYDDILFYDGNGYEYYWIGGMQAALSLFAFALHGIGPGLSGSYGIRSKAAHAAYTILYTLVALGISVIGFSDSVRAIVENAAKEAGFTISTLPSSPLHWIMCVVMLGVGFALSFALVLYSKKSQKSK